MNASHVSPTGPGVTSSTSMPGDLSGFIISFTVLSFFFCTPQFAYRPYIILTAITKRVKCNSHED